MENQGSGLRQNLLHLLNGVTQKGYWYKCFRASEHKFLSAEFHKYCDNKGPTVTIVRSGSQLFGGFTDLSWDGKYSDLISFLIARVEELQLLA